jgi:2,4-diketo-3-deoxy-L-fuconate hydrolase
MRLNAMARDGVAWMTLTTDGGQAWVAPVDQFYADVQRGLALAAQCGAGEASGELAVFVPATAKILCAGLNYVNHAAEARQELPAHPDVFARWASTLVPTGAGVPVPSNEPGLDWEGELAAVIGAELKNATPDEVERSIVGYTILNDLSARHHQRATRQWAIGKNADRSAPFGPELVTSDEIGDPYALRLVTRVDGQVMQDGRTVDMIFRVGQIGAYASETMTLRPGDVISTGTPHGIGSTRTPPVFLTPGSVVEVQIDRIGVLRTVVHGSPDHAPNQAHPIVEAAGGPR